MLLSEKKIKEKINQREREFFFLLSMNHYYTLMFTYTLVIYTPFDTTHMINVSLKSQQTAN